MALSNVAITDTFDLWRTRTNQLVVQSNYFEANLPNYTYTNNIGVTANAFASATIAGANTAVGTAANNFASATIAGANTAVGAGANAFASATIAGANTAVGAGANAYMRATLAGANTAVGAGANAYALSISSQSGTNFTLTLNGANTAVGAGANAFASATIAGANAFASATIAGANTAVGTAANNFASATISGANTAVGNGANAYMRATLSGANTVARDATNLTGGTVPAARLSGQYTGISGVGTIQVGNWNASVIPVLYGGTGQTSINGLSSALGLGSMASQGSASVVITGGSISGITDLAVADGGTGASDATGARTNLGLGSMATQGSGSVSITGGSISGLSSLGVSGDITATGDITAFSASDKRLKTNISQIQDSLHKVNSISGVTFDWNEEGQKSRQSEEEIFGNRREAGVIAQEIEEVLPEVVVTRKDGYKAVRYEKLIPLLIEAIKELTAKVEMLESKIEK